MYDPKKLLIKAIAGAAANLSAAPIAPRECIPPVGGPHAAYIPNTIVITHIQQVARFYDDLIRQRVVLIHCMSIRDEASCAGIEIMAKVSSLIGKDLGKRVFIYSITTNPEHDTPAALRALAEKYQTGNGWLFLTGEPAGLQNLRERLFTHSGGQDCSLHLVRYGNEEVGLWGGVPVSASPEAIMQRLSWITPRERPTGPPVRGGPWPLAEMG